MRDLDLQATYVNDEGLLRHLPDLMQLERLSLAYLNISDDGLSALEHLVWLEFLNLKHTGGSNDAIVGLVSEKAHTLRDLNLSNTVIDDAAIARFPERLQLQRLVLADTGITDAACTQIARFEWLRALDVGLTDITDDGVRDLADTSHLQELELFGTQVTDTSLVWLSDTKVETLGLGYTSVTDAGVPTLADLAELENLNLEATAVTDRGLRFLATAERLKRLYLDNTKISNAGLAFLLKLPLESLSLNAGIDDTGLSTLSRHNSLRRFATWDAKVTTWQPLTHLNRLQVLLVDDSVEELSPLQRLAHLEILLLWGDRFSPTELAKLRLALPKCQIQQFEPHERAIKAFRELCLAR